MTLLTHQRSTKVPHIVATGFTTAYLGDERTLREFIVGDHLVRTMRERGEQAALYLINDTFDPLGARQLRLGVDKDERLIRQFESFCGRPIAEVPDPFGCHESYSAHFSAALIQRLHSLDIHPILLDTYSAYGKGHYFPYFLLTVQHYDEIQQYLAANCQNYTLRNLIRVQCRRCKCIDATEVKSTEALVIGYRCERCGLDTSEPVREIRAKLSWKLDCAARWDLYAVDTETFSKAHLADLGTLRVSSLVSRYYFGGTRPEITSYGDVRISRELSGRLLEMLPPTVLKCMFLERLNRDLDLTREYVETFCRKHQVQPGLSYTDFVRRELPRRAIEANGGAPDDPLLACGRRFAKFYYGRTHDLHLPTAEVITQAHRPTMAAACSLLEYAIELRARKHLDSPGSRAMIKTRLAAIPDAPLLYPFFRRVFGQEDGPNLATLLAVLPREYLAAVHLMLACACGQYQPLDLPEAPVVDPVHRAA